MQTHSKVRLAKPSDEPELLHLAQVMHSEGGMRSLDIGKVREIFARAFDKKGGILVVIGAPGHVRAMMYLLLTQYWYTQEPHLEELFNWVHPDHRHTDYAKIMLESAKRYSDEMSRDAGIKIPLVIGVLSNKRMAAKVRLYRRFFGLPYGATFVHNANFVRREDLSEEDIWRVPSLMKMFFKREERERRPKASARA